MSWAIAVFSAKQLRDGDSGSIDLAVPSVFILSVQIVILDQWSGADIETTNARAFMGLLSFAVAMWIASWLFVGFLRKARQSFVTAAASITFSINSISEVLFAMIKTCAALTIQTIGFFILLATVLLAAAETFTSVSELLAEFILFVSGAMIAPFGDSIFYLIGFGIAVQPTLVGLKIVWVSIRNNSLLNRAKGLLRLASLGVLFIVISAIAFGVIFSLLLWLRSLFGPSDQVLPHQIPAIENAAPTDSQSEDKQDKFGNESTVSEQITPALTSMRVSALEISCEGDYAPLNWVNGSSIEVSSSLFRCDFDSSSISDATRAVVAVGMASPGRSKEREIDRARRRAITLTRWLEIESEVIHLLGLNLGMRVTDDAASIASGFGTRGERPIVVWTINAVPSNAAAERSDIIQALAAHLKSTRIPDAYTTCELFDAADLQTEEPIDWDCGAEIGFQE